MGDFMSYVLGIDLGTSFLKGVLVNRKGEVISTKSYEYNVETIALGYSEQNPKVWIDAVSDVIKELIKDVPEILTNLEGISFSGQMHSLVLLDNEDKPLRNAILWNDVRTSKQCEYIMEHATDDIIRITKNIALEGFTLPKILWVKENEPNIWSQVNKFLLPKDYLGFWMTGNKQMEYSDAAGTLLLDVKTKTWSSSLAEKFNLPKEIFPKLVNSTDKIGFLKKELIDLFGFKKEIPIFSGGADNACGAISAGIINEEQGMCSIGTSGVFLSFEAQIKDYKGKLHFFNHVIKDSYYSMGVTLSAGNSLNWFKNTFAKNEDYDELLEGIAELPIGSNGLLFTPYILGERTPYIDSKIRGSFIGIDVNHTKKNFAKSVLEGITLSLKDSQNLMKKFAGKTFKEIISVGGGAKNKDWLQMQSDIFNSKIVTLKVEQGAAVGAAMIAAVGVGWFADINCCVREFVTYNDEYIPIKDNVKKYAQLYNLYKEVYPATKKLCK